MRISSSDSKGAGSTWHSDYSYLEQPAKYTAFFMREIPRVGGNTGFANLYTAYEALSESMKTLLSDKSAVHDNSHRHYRQYAEGDTYLSKDDYASFPPVIHPLVREHPATGRKALFFGEADTVSIVGLPYLESQAIIGFLTNHCAQMEFLYRHVWAPGDLVLWDNRCVNHCAIQDYDLNEPREGMIACAHDRLST